MNKLKLSISKDLFVMSSTGPLLSKQRYVYRTSIIPKVDSYHLNGSRIRLMFKSRTQQQVVVTGSLTAIRIRASESDSGSWSRCLVILSLVWRGFAFLAATVTTTCVIDRLVNAASFSRSHRSRIILIKHCFKILDSIVKLIKVIGWISFVWWGLKIAAAWLVRCDLHYYEIQRSNQVTCQTLGQRETTLLVKMYPCYLKTLIFNNQIILAKQFCSWSKCLMPTHIMGNFYSWSKSNW